MTNNKAVHRALPDNAKAHTHTFTIGGHEGIITVSVYEDGTPGQILIWMLKEGASFQGLLNGACVALSIALQYGAPVTAILAQFKGLAFEPSGWTRHPKIAMAKSVLDYLACWLEIEFPELMPLKGTREGVSPAHQEVQSVPVDDCPPCTSCGKTMAREDNGYRCSNCGATAGLG